MKLSIVAEYSFNPTSPLIKIRVPAVYMARNVMILMRANPFRGPLKIEAFWVLKWQRAKRVPFGPLEGRRVDVVSEFTLSRPPPPPYEYYTAAEKH